MKYLKVVMLLVSVSLLTMPAASDEGEKEGPRRGLRAVLRSFAEVPSISSPTMGKFRARISDESSIQYELSYDEFATGVLFSHIHVAQRGVNGAIVAFLCGGGGKPACPSPSGTVTGTITPDNISTVQPQGIEGTPAERFAKVLEAIRARVAYVNVHTDAHKGGEIRGQIRASREEEDED